MSTFRLCVPGAVGYLIAGYEMDTNPDDPEAGEGQDENPQVIILKNPSEESVQFSVYWPVPTMFPVGGACRLVSVEFAIRVSDGMRCDTIRIFAGSTSEPISSKPVESPADSGWLSVTVQWDELEFGDSALGIVMDGSAEPQSELAVANVCAFCEVGE
jgi:hypothetical protein